MVDDRIKAPEMQYGAHQAIAQVEYCRYYAIKARNILRDRLGIATGMK